MNGEGRPTADSRVDSVEADEDNDDAVEGRGRTTMIDCISMEAPDDVLIKPSVLRESMRR